MQQRIAARDDWAFVAHESTFVSICREPFSTPDEVSQRVRDVIAIVTALPASVAPAQVDHSVDDLLVRTAGIDNLGQAIAFLSSSFPMATGSGSPPRRAHWLSSPTCARLTRRWRG
jgi:hypothetical protein